MTAFRIPSASAPTSPFELRRGYGEIRRSASRGGGHPAFRIPHPARRFAVACFIGVSSLACSGPPPPPSVDALAFPVLVLFEQSGVVRHDDRADLRTMSVQRVVGSNAPPFLIDSRLDVYRLEKLASVHGGMWLMANPSGTTEVTFELMRVAQADAAQARRLIAERDGGLRNDPDPVKLAALERAGTLAEMLSVVGR